MNKTPEQRKRHYNKKDSIITLAKSVPCADCNEPYPSYVMDLDHVRGVKKFNISSTRNRSYEDLRNEIAKCDVVCANCHRIRTHNRKLALLV